MREAGVAQSVRCWACAVPPTPIRQMRKQRPGKIRELARGPSGSGGTRTVTDLFYLSPHVSQGLSC